MQIVLVSLFAAINCGVIHQEVEHGKATSYQSIKFEHFHAVPTYIKKEHQHLLEHPVAVGESSSDVKIHHGDKHDHGYAVTNVNSNLHNEGLSLSDAEEHRAFLNNHAATNDINEHEALIAAGENYADHSQNAGLVSTDEHEHAYVQVARQQPIYSIHETGEQDASSNHKNYADASLGQYQVSEGESHEQGNQQMYGIPAGLADYH